jgi:hypothetical protein
VEIKNVFVVEGVGASSFVVAVAVEDDSDKQSHKEATLTHFIESGLLSVFFFKYSK